MAPRAHPDPDSPKNRDEDMSEINGDRSIPTLGGPDPDFSIMANPDGNFVSLVDDWETNHRNARHY